MAGAKARIKRDIEMQNRSVWNVAALTGAAFGGKLPDYEKVFGSVQNSTTQDPETQEAMLKALAVAWGV